MSDFEHNPNDELPGDTPEEGQPEDDFSIEGQGWDILVGGRDNAENLGGDDPFGLDDLPEEEPEPDIPVIGAVDDAAPLAASTTDGGEEEPRERHVIEMNALADEAFDEQVETVEATSAPEVPVMTEPETPETPEPILPVDAGEAAPEHIPGMDPAAEEEPVVLEEPEPVGVVDTPQDDAMTLDDLLSADASSEPETGTEPGVTPSLPEVPDWSTIAGEASTANAEASDEGEVIEVEETPVASTGTTPTGTTISSIPPMQVAAHQLLQRNAIADPFSGPIDPFTRDTHDHDTYTEDTYETDIPTNVALRNMLVTPKRITELWEEIDEVYDMVVNDVRGHFETTEAAIADLQKAKMLLMSSEDNYDNAQQLLMHVKARLRLEQKVRSWTRTRGTWLAIYLIAWLFLITLLSFMTNRVSAVMDLFVPSWMVSMYLPALFGGMGGVIGALWVLIKHAAQKRDFDPIHTTWYVTNPFMGLALGVIAYLVVWGGGNVLTSVASPGATTFTEAGETSIALYLICLIVGFNQNLLWRLLDKFIKSITPADDEDNETAGAANTGTE